MNVSRAALIIASTGLMLGLSSADADDSALGKDLCEVLGWTWDATTGCTPDSPSGGTQNGGNQQAGNGAGGSENGGGGSASGSGSNGNGSGSNASGSSGSSQSGSGGSGSSGNGVGSGSENSGSSAGNQSPDQWWCSREPNRVECVFGTVTVSENPSPTGGGGTGGNTCDPTDPTCSPSNSPCQNGECTAKCDATDPNCGTKPPITKCDPPTEAQMRAFCKAAVADGSITVNDTGDCKGWTSDQTTGVLPVTANCKYIEKPGSCPQYGTFENPFSADSAFNQHLGSGTTFLADSAIENKSWLSRKFGAVDTTRYGVMVYRGSADTDKPSGMKGSEGRDSLAAVISPTSGREYYHLTEGEGGYSMSWKVGSTGTSTDGKTRAGITAAGTSVVAGLIRGSDVESGKIQHAIQAAMSHGFLGGPDQLANKVVSPAVTTDWFCAKGQCHGDIPYGARFALPPNAQLPDSLSGVDAMVAATLKDYGMIVIDGTGGNPATRGDQTIPGDKITQIRDAIRKFYPLMRMVDKADLQPCEDTPPTKAQPL